MSNSYQIYTAVKSYVDEISFYEGRLSRKHAEQAIERYVRTESLAYDVQLSSLNSTQDVSED